MTPLARRVLQTIAQKPNIRTIEICDTIDCEIELVEQVLAVLLKDKQIQATDGVAPNGRMAKFFDLFKDTLPATATPTLTATKSKVDLAIDFIREHGRATTEQMRQVMDLKSHQHPLAWLSAAITNGRLARAKEFWILGEGAIPVKPRTIPPRAPSKPAPVTQGAAVPTPSTPTSHAPMPPAKPEAAEPAAAMRIKQIPVSSTGDRRSDCAGEFVAGLFSDGELHLRVSGNWIALTSDQTTTLRQLLKGAA